MPQYDVRRYEVVCVTIRDVEAASPAEALAKTDTAVLSAAIDRECEVPLNHSVTPGAYVSSVAFAEDAPVAALVDIAGSQGAQGEDIFNHDDRAGVWRSAEEPRLDPQSPKAYMGQLEITIAGLSQSQKVLIVARDDEAATQRLIEAAMSYYCEPDEVTGDEVEGFLYDAGAAEVRIRPVPGLTRLTASQYEAMRGLLLCYEQDGCPEPLAIDGPEVGVVPQLDRVLGTVEGALLALADQIGQMRGMFDDEDQTIQDAVDAGELATEAVRRLRGVLSQPAAANGDACDTAATATDDAIDKDSDEVVVRLADGWSLRSGSTQSMSGDYVRLCRPGGQEHLYWHHDEWAADPVLVMGAILNAAAGLRMVQADSNGPAHGAVERERP